MPLTRLIIKNFKSIKNCDISLSELNVLIGENGTGKTNLLDAISYFYRNLTDSDISEHVFDENNHYSKYLENEDHLKSTLREFENNFPELYSLIERLCDIICE